MSTAFVVTRPVAARPSRSPPISICPRCLDHPGSGRHGGAGAAHASSGLLSPSACPSWFGADLGPLRPPAGAPAQAGDLCRGGGGQHLAGSMEALLLWRIAPGRCDGGLGDVRACAGAPSPEVGARDQQGTHRLGVTPAWSIPLGGVLAEFFRAGGARWRRWRYSVRPRRAHRAAFRGPCSAPTRTRCARPRWCAPGSPSCANPTFVWRCCSPRRPTAAVLPAGGLVLRVHPPDGAVAHQAYGAPMFVIVPPTSGDLLCRRLLVRFSGCSARWRSAACSRWSAAASAHRRLVRSGGAAGSRCRRR